MSFDIEDSIEEYYRQIIANDITDSLLHSQSDDDNVERVRWFNEGLKFAAMIARSGLH